MTRVRVHDLKTWPGPFAAMWAHEKTHEVRRNDRGFAVGDLLRLREYEPGNGGYTDRVILARVSYVSEGGTWGLPSDLCVLSIQQQTRAEKYRIGMFDQAIVDAAASREGRVEVMDTDGLPPLPDYDDVPTNEGRLRCIDDPAAFWASLAPDDALALLKAALKQGAHYGGGVASMCRDRILALLAQPAAVDLADKSAALKGDGAG
jgi:hypothetical protein